MRVFAVPVFRKATKKGIAGSGQGKEQTGRSEPEGAPSAPSTWPNHREVHDLNRFRKAISVGMTATLLASLMATVAAPAAFAALTSTTGGTIVPGGGSSAVFTLTAAEDSVADFGNGSFTVNVRDNAGVDVNVTWDTSSVPSVTVLAGVGGATAGFVGDTLVVNVTGTDVTKIDSFRINNLKVAAGAGAAAGAAIFSVTADGVGLPEGLVPGAGVTT